MWSKMDNIVAVSEGCRDSFLSSFPYINKKVEIIENIYLLSSYVNNLIKKILPHVIQVKS